MLISRVHGAKKQPLRKQLTPDGVEIKKVLPDGREVSPVDWPTLWFGSTQDVNITQVASLYDGIEPHECLILGGRPNGRVTGDERSDFKLPPVDLVVFDIDGMPYAEGMSDDTLIADPQSTVARQVELMFGTKTPLHVVVALSSRAGFTGDFRAHVWMGVADLHVASDIAQFQRSLKKNYLDTGIFQSGRVLFAAPPDIENDPFDTRIFEFTNEGMVAKLPVKSTEGMVQLSKPITRGKHNLYQINAERLHAGEFVSEECFNFALSAKRAGKTEDEMIDALRTEFERIDPPQSTWDRMRKHIRGAEDATLGDARRMYRKMRTGETTVFGEPAYVEPQTTLDAASEELRAAVASQLGQSGTFLNKVTLGVGKTHEIVDLVTSNDVKALILAPNHERCNEIVTRLEAAREKRLYSILDEVGQFDDIEEQYLERPWASWRGRSADGMCSRLEAVNAAFRAGVSVHKHICGFPSEGDDDNVKRCPKFATCSYADQVMNFWRYNWVAPVSMIQHLSRIASGADVVIIDEGCVDKLAGQRVVPLEDLLAPRPGRLGELSRQAHTDLLDDTRTLTVDQVTEALDLELEEKPTPFVEPDMTDEEIISLCAPGSYRSGCVSLWRGLKAEFEGGKNHLHVNEETKKDENGEDATRWWAQVSWRVKPRLLEKVDTVLLFDATPNTTALRAHWPEIKVVDVQAPNINLDVVQVVDSVGKRSQLINDLPKSDPKYKAEEERVMKARARITAWLKAQPGYSVVVTKKAHREAIEAEHSFERVSFAHHGAVEGQDIWDFPDGTKLNGANVDNLVVLGRSAPPPYEAEAIARQHHCDEDAIKTMGWYRTEHWELTNGVAGYRLRHDDHRVDAVIQNIAVDGQMQAIGRMRGVRRAKRGRVFIMHSMRLDLAVTECVSAAAMMRRVGDVTLLSRKEVDRVFGAGGDGTPRALKHVAATHKYWMVEGQTQPYRCAVSMGADVDQCMAELGALRWAAM